MSIEESVSTWMAKALQYQELLEGARRERDSALALHDKAAEQLGKYKERAETAERERDAAIIKAAKMKEELELVHSQGRQQEASKLNNAGLVLIGGVAVCTEAVK